MNGKKTLWTKFWLLFVITTFVLLPSWVSAAAKEAGPAVTLKLSHQWPQDPEDYVIKTGIKFVDEVNKRSGGAIKINFYPAESLSKAAAQFKAMRQGTIDLSILPLIYAAGEIAELNAISVPWANTHDNFFALRKTKLWEFLEEKLNKVGVKTLSWIQIASGIASTKKQIIRPPDVKGMQIRASGKYIQKVFQDMGAGSVNMASSEIYSAMQRGLLDAVQTSSSSFASYKIFEVAKYYNSPVDYSILFTNEPICISMQTWEKLTPAQQEIMLQVGRELEPFAFEEAKAEDKRVTQLFAKNKVTVYTMSKQDWMEWRAQMEGSIQAFRKDVPNGEWLVSESLKLYQN